jgi:hypothetical protein
MRKWIFIFIPLIFVYLSSEAQENVSCNQLLADAREAYSAGMVEIVPELLLPCLEPGGLTGTPKQEAYKLVINAYLFDYLPEEADSLMDRFVEEFPQYKTTIADPAEFSGLFESHLAALGITQAVVAMEPPEPEPVKEEEDKEIEKKTKVKVPFVYENSIGFLLGVNGSFPQITQRYSVGNPTGSVGSFGMMPGFQGGALINLVLNRSIEVTFGLVYSQTKFRFTDTPFPFTSYDYEETQSHLQIPASILFKLNPKTKGASIYLRLGIVGDFLLSASGQGTRTYEGSTDKVVVGKTTISDSRTRLNLLGDAGLGLRIPFEKSFLFMEAGFKAGFIKSNKAENRYRNDDLVWLLYHVDSDYWVMQFSFSAGMAWNL